jgi:hypothetical protein
MQADYPALSSPLDYDLSPFTGWTRQHWDELATLILSGVSGFFSPGRAWVRIPGQSAHGLRVDCLEGFARSLTIASVWFLERDKGRVSQGPSSPDLLEYYQTGLAHGTDPAHKEYWGNISDYDQRIVEAAELAWSLYIARQYLWDPLSGAEKDQVAGWLAQVNGKKTVLNNWKLFGVIVNAVLRALGQPHSEQEIGQGLQFVEELYRGDGWYQDGLCERFDYYTPWMFHDCLLKLVLIDGALTPSDAGRCVERAGRFLVDYQHFFAADGSHPCFGRSQIYRPAAISPVVMSVLTGGTTLSPGLSRRLASGSLSFFLGHGLISQRGNLTLGFTRTFPAMTEGYSCSCSPYMIGKAFSALLLPPEHSFWTAVEEPLPVERQDYSIAIPVAGLLLDGEKRGGQVQLINHKSECGTGFGPKKTGNLAYSSHFGYEATIRRGQYNYDSAILLSSDGKAYYGRCKPFHLQTRPGFGASFFLPFGDTDTIVYTNTILCDHFQIRVHYLLSDRSLQILEGGYALGYDEGTPIVLSGPDWEFARHGSRGSFIRRLVGYDYNIPAGGFGGTQEGNNVLHRYSITPGVGLSGGFHRHMLLATLVRGSTNGEQPEDLADSVQDAQHDPDGFGWLIFHLRNGDALFTQVGPIRDKIIYLNGVKVAGRTTFARVSREGEIVAHYQDLR